MNKIQVGVDRVGEGTYQGASASRMIGWSKYTYGLSSQQDVT
jgi:hypothetical protein